MKVKEGAVYYIKDEYFDLVKGCEVKGKTNKGRTSPAYCCFIDIDRSVLWMIPMSRKTGKYQAIYKKEMEKYGHCYSVVLGTYDREEAAFQIQGMFPVAKKHILSPHTREGNNIPVKPAIREEIRYKFNKLQELDKKGIKGILTDIKRIEQIILAEL